MEQNEVDLIDSLKVIWKRKGLIVGGTLVAAAAALVVSLSMPKTYEVSRTLKIGQLPTRRSERVYVVERSGTVTRPLMGGVGIEDHEAVIERIRDHRLLKMAIDKFHLEITTREMEAIVSIDAKINPNVRYIVRAYDAELATRIADLLANLVIKIHRPIFERGMQLVQEYEKEIEAKIPSLERENREMKKTFKRIIRDQNVDPTSVVLLQANIGERERNLADLQRELNETRLSRLGYENTSVIAADVSPQYPVKPRVKLNVALVGTLGLMGFTFLAFFLEYIERARSKE